MSNNFYRCVKAIGIVIVVVVGLFKKVIIGNYCKISYKYIKKELLSSYTITFFIYITREKSPTGLSSTTVLINWYFMKIQHTICRIYIL